ncbi:hypothetical protein [Paenibacillus gansuensis]|uniref:Uncharacterized protein n=1 Tax=Paenibacillus gansuensis TaxID=306542 RepID=A0ABW5PIQ6_9BACL
MNPKEYERDEPAPEFNAEQMLRLVEKDLYLKFLFNDLRAKGNEETDLLEILFNSNVVGDSIYTSEYEGCR